MTLAMHQGCGWNEVEGMKKSHIVFVVLSSTVFISARAAIAASAEAKTSPLRVVDLRTEHMVNPIGVGEINPLLTWQVQGAAHVKAYEIRVARTPTDLGQGKFLWDSGQVAWPGVGAVYLSQVKLSSRERVAWQVRVCDAQNQISPWSAPATTPTTGSRA